MLSHTADAAVWATQAEWSEQWEQRYAQWVEKNWTAEVYSNPASPYLGQETDCADACYDMRAIFAYENGLPFIVSARAKDGSRISNAMRTWDHLSQKDRLKAFLSYVHDRTSTETLGDDTYPVAMSPKGVMPGSIYVQPGSSSHCFQIIKVNEYGVPSTLSSTVPRVARELYLEHNFPAFVPSDTRRYRDGYRRFRSPEHIGLPVTQVPGFSDEQYRLAASKGLDYIGFTDSLLQRLGSKREPAPMRAQRFMYNVCYYARQRVEIVQGALDHLAATRSSGRQCLSASEYYDHSTDSRDRRLKEYFSRVRQLIASPTWSDADWTNKAYRAEWYLKPYAEAIFRTDDGSQESSKSRRKTKQVTDADLIAWCGIEYKPGERISLRTIWRGIERGAFSADPHASREQRWGLTGAPYQPSCRQF